MTSPSRARGGRPDEDALLVVMRVRGPERRDALTRDSGLPAPRAAAALAVLAGRGLVADAAPGGERIQLSAAGREASRAAAAREREHLEACLGPRYAAFAGLDRQIKEVITRWQIRVVAGVSVANDHRDRAYDGAVLAELRSLCEAAVAWLAPLAELRPRYRRYGERLSSSARAAEGEGAWVCGLGVDSVHSVWWQLHGELLLLLGRSRED